MKAENKVFVVTGGGSGLGRELVLHLLSKGATVAAVDIRVEALEETFNEAGGNKDRLSTHVADITDINAVQMLPKEVIAQHGTVDGLINNAGIIQPFVKVKDLEYKDIDRVMKINFYGALYMTKSFLPYLLERPEGHIINISSMGGFLPVPGQSIYGASKAAIKLFTEGLYAELLKTNVRVTVVFPGAMKTNIAANSGVKINNPEADKSKEAIKALPANKAAEIIIKGMEKNAFRVLVGSDSKTMDYLYRLNPKYATNLIYKNMRSLLSED